jgi:hypothetical protein
MLCCRSAVYPPSSSTLPFTPRILVLSSCHVSPLGKIKDYHLSIACLPSRLWPLVLSFLRKNKLVYYSLPTLLRIFGLDRTHLPLIDR